jgi:hypothetical protein
MKLYRLFGLLCSVIFVIVGLIFLLMPDRVLMFFNTLPRPWGLVPTPEVGVNFYIALAVAYMYLATVLAFLMFRFPDNSWFPLLLANGKLASSVLSLYVFVAHLPSLILVANCVVDGLIGVAALFFYRKIKNAAP